MENTDYQLVVALPVAPSIFSSAGNTCQQVPCDPAKPILVPLPDHSDWFKVEGKALDSSWTNQILSSGNPSVLQTPNHREWLDLSHLLALF